MKQEMKEALAFLVELLELGVDLEDAKYQTQVSFEVDGDELDRAYDEFIISNGITLE